MKKKFILCGLIVIVCVIAIFIQCICSVPAGNTIESREILLNNSISKGKGWSIVKENVIDDYIISAAYSTDGKVTLAVFEPLRNGKYRFMRSTNRDNDDIVIGRAIINGNWYDLIWFNGAQTEYAEITYTINGQLQDTLRYNTIDMDIICHKNFSKNYSMSVVYFDSNGNKYE